jgi:hypothetical protein
MTGTPLPLFGSLVPNLCVRQPLTRKRIVHQLGKAWLQEKALNSALPPKPKLDNSATPECNTRFPRYCRGVIVVLPVNEGIFLRLFD